MDNQSKPADLIQRYRNTLISLARHYDAMLDKAYYIRIEAEMEQVAGRKNGLYCHANVMRKNAQQLKEILYEDRAMLYFFFQTANLQTIAKETIEL